MRSVLCLVACLFLVAVPAHAADLVPWRIVPAGSMIGFTAHDSTGGGITGGFGRFTGTILFDPERLSESKISIDVDVTSVTAAWPDVQTDLPKPQWLSIAAFPKAHYETSAIAKRPDGQYEAKGTLTLKGMAAPVTLVFTLPTYEVKRAVAKGTARLSRGAFKVGEGSDLVADPVDLAFTVTADRP